MSQRAYYAVERPIGDGASYESVLAQTDKAFAITLSKWVARDGRRCDVFRYGVTGKRRRVFTATPGMLMMRDEIETLRTRGYDA